MRLAWVVLACACGKAPFDAPGTCLPLPALERDTLVSDGGALYWLESIHTYNYQGDLRGFSQLVRYDLASHERVVLVDHALAPIVFLAGKPVVRRELTQLENTVLSMIEPDGSVHALSPDNLDVLDAEAIDDHTIAFLADGDATRAVYTLSLDRSRAVRLVDADMLVSVADGRVIATSGDQLIAVDPATGKRDTYAAPKHITPDGRFALFAKDATVRAQDMLGGHEHRVIDEPGDWKLVHQQGSVLARTGPDKSELARAYLIAHDAATPLASLRGNTTVIGAVRAGDRTWALVGHNVANYAGDFGALSTEADVCVLPDSGEVSFATRNVPARYADKQQALFDAARAFDGTVQVLDDVRVPPTLFLKLTSGGGDLAALRARARDAHAHVTSILADRDVMTELELADHRSGRVRWRRDYQRVLVTAGMGDAQIADPADVDLDAELLVDGVLDGQAHCAGKLVNRRDRAYDDVEIRCTANDREHAIHIAHIAPHGSADFDTHYDAGNDSEAFSVVAGSEPLVVRDVAGEARTQAVLDIALATSADTQLALAGRRATNPGLEVSLVTEADFDELSDDARTKAAATAYERYSVLEPRPLVLAITVRGTDSTYRFDGVSLERD